MKPIHIGRRNAWGIRALYTRASRLSIASGKHILAHLLEDSCPDEREKKVTGWYWHALDDSYSRTFRRMRDAVLDFKREYAERCRCVERELQESENEHWHKDRMD